MLVSVRERTREIGIRKAIGARGRDILAQFLIEALTLSVMGGMFGIVLGILVSALIGAIAGWGLQISALTVVAAVGFSLLVGIVFGVWPARQAARLDPITAAQVRIGASRVRSHLQLIRRSMPIAEPHCQTPSHNRHPSSLPSRPRSRAAAARSCWPWPELVAVAGIAFAAGRLTAPAAAAAGGNGGNGVAASAASRRGSFAPGGGSRAAFGAVAVAPAAFGGARERFAAR